MEIKQNSKQRKKIGREKKKRMYAAIIAVFLVLCMVLPMLAILINIVV